MFTLWYAPEIAKGKEVWKTKLTNGKGVIICRLLIISTGLVYMQTFVPLFIPSPGSTADQSMQTVFPWQWCHQLIFHPYLHHLLFCQPLRAVSVLIKKIWGSLKCDTRDSAVTPNRWLLFCWHDVFHVCLISRMSYWKLKRVCMPGTSTEEKDWPQPLGIAFLSWIPSRYIFCRIKAMAWTLEVISSNVLSSTDNHPASEELLWRRIYHM